MGFGTLVRGALDAFSRGDVDAILRHIHAECEWEENSARGFAGLDRSYREPAGVRRWIADTHRIWGSLVSTVEDVVVGSHAAVVAIRLQARGRQEIDVDMMAYDVIWPRGRMIIRRRYYNDRAEAVAAADLPAEHFAAA